MILCNVLLYGDSLPRNLVEIEDPLEIDFSKGPNTKLCFIYRNIHEPTWLIHSS